MKRVFREGAWQDVRCEDLHVGELVQVKEGDECPADIILVSSSSPDGLCYIETGAGPSNTAA